MSRSSTSPSTIYTRPDQSALPAADAVIVPVEPGSPLRELFLADATTGTGPQIALRFTQALQAGEHLTAARELYITGRALLATRDLPFLDQVMTDVTRPGSIDRRNTSLL